MAIKLKKIPKKILIIKPSSLGDIIHGLPFLDAVKTAFPEAEIQWVVAKGLEGLLENHPMVSRLWIIKKDQWKNYKKIGETAAEIRGLFPRLKAESFDVVIDLQGLLRSGLIAYATRSPVRIGFSEAREGSSYFYNYKVEGGRDIHAVERYLKLASFIGCGSDIRFPMPLVMETEKVKAIKKELGAYAVMVPGARWKTKQWDAEKFGKLASMLDIKTVVVGSAADDEIAGIIEGASNGKAVSLAGKTDLKELISIIRGARFAVSNDSGPMHIAAAANIPVVAIFGPTNPVRTGPYGSRHIIVQSDISCVPCYKKRCKAMKCMSGVSVEMVCKAVKELAIGYY